MPRPLCCRHVEKNPVVERFAPQGTPSDGRREFVVTLDEFEAIRLCDLEGLRQQDAAVRMGVSRPTLGRIIAEARRKVAAALVGGAALRIGGGAVCRCAEPDAGDAPGWACRRRRMNCGLPMSCGLATATNEAEASASMSTNPARPCCRARRGHAGD